MGAVAALKQYRAETAKKLGKLSAETRKLKASGAKQKATAAGKAKSATAKIIAKRVKPSAGMIGKKKGK